MTRTYETRSTDGLANLRDCGGLPTEDGASTRPGVLYRSEAPLVGDPAPALDLGGGWPPPTVIDLRSSAELNGVPHPLVGPSTTVHHVPLLEALSPTELAEHQHDDAAMYGLFVRSCGERLAEAFRIAAASEHGPALVHCAAGKDRTGIVVAMLLRSVGVTRDAVVADYLRSNDNLAGMLRRLGIRADDADQYRVHSRAIEQALDVMEDHPDGMPGWLADRGVDRELVAGWRRRFVTE